MPLWFFEVQARQLCLDLGDDPDENIPLPGYPDMMAQPRWVHVARLLVERSIEYKQITPMAPSLDELKKLVEKKRKERFGC